MKRDEEDREFECVRDEKEREVKQGGLRERKSLQRRCCSEMERELKSKEMRWRESSSLSRSVESCNGGLEQGGGGEGGGRQWGFGLYGGDCLCALV